MRRSFLAIFCFIVVSLLIKPSVHSAQARTSAENARHYDVTYKVSIPASIGFSQGLRLWIPLAASSNGQELVSRVITPSADIPYEITQDPMYGNEIIYLELREPLEEELAIDIRYRVRSDANFQLTGRPGPARENLEKYLEPSRLMVIDQTVKGISQEVIGDQVTTTAKARAIYDYVIENMRYEKETPGWGEGDTVRACLVGAGNCTDFHSLFISVARASDIPARFQIGLQLPEDEEGQIPGYHCWAQFHDDERGWLTVDASEAWKNPERREFYFGGFDVNKFMISTGRDITVAPSPENGPVNIFFYPYAEMDGAVFGAIRTEFYYKEDIQEPREEEMSV